MSHSSPAWNHRNTKDSDTSSIEDLGKAYVVGMFLGDVLKERHTIIKILITAIFTGVSMHNSSGQPSTPTSVNGNAIKILQFYFTFLC